MTDSSIEEVLCSSVTDLPPAWLPVSDAVELEEQALLSGLASQPPCWLPRSRAEVDFSFKQWVTYVILRNLKGEILCYSRLGNETRLHGCLSLGVGGHINPQDDESELFGASRWRHLFRCGLERELLEEYPGAAAGEADFAGIVHESQSQVGLAHIGLVYVQNLHTDPGLPGPELRDHFWLHPRELDSSSQLIERFELWSRLALRLLGKYNS